VVRGNHERWLLEDPFACQPRLHRRGQPRSSSRAAGDSSLATVRGDLLLCHGVGDNDMVRLHPEHQETVARGDACARGAARRPALRLVVGGHTHRRMVRAFARAGGPPLVFINPGTLHRGYPASFAVVDLGRGQVEFFEVLAEPGSPVVVEPAEVALLPA
jgi:predicted phosphodiesterase